MSVPVDKKKLLDIPALELPPRYEPPRPKPGSDKLYDFDKADGLNTSLVQRMRRKAELNALIFSPNHIPGRRHSKVMIVPPKPTFHTPTPAPTPRNSITQSAPPVRHSVGFNEKVSTIETEIKTIRDKNPDLAHLNQMKGMSIALTPALKKQRGRSRTTDDITKAKPQVRCSTPHPRPLGD